MKHNVPITNVAGLLDIHIPTLRSALKNVPRKIIIHSLQMSIENCSEKEENKRSNELPHKKRRHLFERYLVILVTAVWSRLWNSIYAQGIPFMLSIYESVNRKIKLCAMPLPLHCKQCCFEVPLLTPDPSHLNRGYKVAENQGAKLTGKNLTTT